MATHLFLAKIALGFKIPSQNQEAMLSALIGGAGTNNPGELAHYLLEQVLELSGEVPADDMTILAVGLWKV